MEGKIIKKEVDKIGEDIQIKIEPQIEANLKTLSETVGKRVREFGFPEEISKEIQDLTLKYALEIERIINVLKDYPALKDFTREESFLKNKNTPEFISIYMIDGTKFIKNILEVFIPREFSFIAPANWPTAEKQNKERIKLLKKDIEKEFNMSYDICSKILKREAVPVLKWEQGSEKGREGEWVQTNKFLED